MERYFATWADECGITIDTLMSLGALPRRGARRPVQHGGHGAAPGRQVQRGGAPARAHQPGDVPALWPAVPAEEVPIGSITNGVHGRTWVSSQMDDLYSKYVSPAWDEAGPDEWARIDDARDDELWRAREQGRDALVSFVRERLRKLAGRDRGLSVSDAAWTDDVLDPRFLIVGFSRRFATYKRATLLLSQPDRLRALLLDEQRPLQLVFAGKAHPADDLGKEMIAQIVRFSRDPAVRHRITFVEDYDISVARILYQGSDVWLNTPRRPMEASGTSGEKAALNGALNCSILDGWWDEMFDGSNGWAISSAESITDLEHRDEVEANSLFELLERQIIPLFYDRGAGRFPRDWVTRIKASLRSLGPKVMASRMVRDYLADMYEPIATQSDALAGNRLRPGPRAGRLEAAGHGSLARGQGRRGPRSGGRLGRPGRRAGGHRRGPPRVSLTPDDVAVELLHGPVAAGDELTDTEVVRLQRARRSSRVAKAVAPPIVVRYRGRFSCRPGGPPRVHGAGRALPPGSLVPVELGCITWA